MAVIFLEEILEQGRNKFLTVNIAAQRARQLNEKGIPMLMNNVQKPVMMALEAMLEGKIDYKELDQLTDTLEDSPFPSISADDEEVERLEEVHPIQEHHDDDDDKVKMDPDEQEEGL